MVFLTLNMSSFYYYILHLGSINFIILSLQEKSGEHYVAKIAILMIIYH